MRIDNDEKMKKYERYIEKREERNLRTQALSRYVFGILREEDFEQKASVPIIFIDEDLETIDLPHANSLMIKLRIGDAIVS